MKIELDVIAINQTYLLKERRSETVLIVDMYGSQVEILVPEAVAERLVNHSAEQTPSRASIGPQEALEEQKGSGTRSTLSPAPVGVSTGPSMVEAMRSRARAGYGDDAGVEQG